MIAAIAFVIVLVIVAVASAIARTAGPSRDDDAGPR